MIVFFVDRQMNILGSASTLLPGGLHVVDDLKTEDVDSGVASFEFDVPFSVESRAEVERCASVGNYILRSNGREHEFYTIIESETDTKKQRVSVYAEDAGLDLLNEICGPFAADQAYPISYYIEKFAFDSGFEIGVNEVDALTRKLSWEGEATATARLASVATQFDNCEISFSFAIKGLQVTHKYINIYEKRGKDISATLRLNEDIDRIVTKKSIANLATALLPTGGTPEDSETPLDLNGYTYDDGDIYLEGKYLKSRRALEKWSRYQNPAEPNADYTGHILKTYSYDTLSQSELCNRAVNRLKEICNLDVNYEVEISKLPDNVQIGDRVNIVDHAGALYVSARILKLETSVCNQKQTATIGEYLLKGSGISQKVADLAEDFARQAQAASKALEAAKKAASDSATAKAELEDVKSRVTAAEDDISAVGDAAAAAQETADAARTEAGEAADAASDAASKANNAASKADDASSKANAASSKADAAASAASDAAKTATNFIGYDAANGLILGNKTGGTWSGYRTQVKSDSFNVLNASGSTLASFGANEISLGNNSEDSKILFCDGKGTIRVVTSGEFSGYTQLSADYLNYFAKYRQFMGVENTQTIGTGSDATHYTYGTTLDMGDKSMNIETRRTYYPPASSSSGIKTTKSNISIVPDSVSVTADMIELNGYVSFDGETKDSAVWNPKAHASTAMTYGVGDGSKYGHVKLSDATNGAGGATGGVAATPKAVKAAYDLASQASSAASSAYDLANEAGQVATDAAQTAADAQSAADAAQAAVGGKAPTNHASTGTTYGKGTSTNYGHVKLSDSILSTSDTAGGTAATPGAVKKAYDLANRAETTLLGGKKIVCGWSAVSFKNTGQTNTTINFGTTFTAKPIVIIGQPFNGVICTVFKDSVTTTNFTVNVPSVGSSTVSTRQMAWVAIGSV